MDIKGRMKKFYNMIVVAGVIGTTKLYASFDGTVTLSLGTYQDGNGGEFKAVTTANAGHTSLGTFYSFCLEYNEQFTSGHTYNYRENTGSVSGGVSGQNATDPNTGKTMDNISIGAAFLYSNFRTGGLVVSSAAAAGALQNAIWYLEGEISWTQLFYLNGANGYNDYQLALHNAGGNNVTLTDAQLKADAAGAFGVVALNLYDPASGKFAQDQLGLDYNFYKKPLGGPVPVPEPTTIFAGALLLLPFGAGMIRILRKSQN